MSDNTFTRGDSFETHSDPTTDRAVVLDSRQISGYRAIHVAERRDEAWQAFWVKETYLHDEVNLGATEYTGPVSEDEVWSIEQALDAPEAVDGVDAVASLD